MLPSNLFNANVLPVINPAAIVDDAAFTSSVVDCGSDAVQGSKFLVFAIQTGSIDADLAVLRVMESDTLTDSTTLGGTPTEVLDVTAKVTPGATDDGKVYLVTVDLRADRKRYVQLQVTAGNGAAGTFLSAQCWAVNPHLVQTDNNAAAHVSG